MSEADLFLILGTIYLAHDFSERVRTVLGMIMLSFYVYLTWFV